MKRKLRILGGAFVATLVLAAVSASAASAVEYHSESENTTLTGVQAESLIFSIPAGTFKCSVVTFAGASAGKTTKTTQLAPTLTGCTLAGAAATIDMNGCTYTFLEPTAIEVPTKYRASLALDCPAGKQVETTAPTCTVDIKAQTLVASVDFHNTGIGATREVDARFTVEKTHVVQTGTKCLGNGGKAEATSESGRITGSALFTGEITGTNTHTGIWVE